MMTGRERLRYLADHVLPNVKHSEFNMSRWACGTVACAAGHAARDPVLTAEGLRLQPSPLPGTSIPYYAGMAGLGAAARFFEISSEDACMLFISDHYPVAAAADITPAQVRERILDYLAEHPAP